MKRIFFILSFLVIAVSLFAGKFTIKSMNVKSIKIGNNRTCYEGSDFYDYEVIHWTSANEEMIVLDHQANKKRCFSKSLFEANKLKTAGDFYKKVNTPATLSASASVMCKIIPPAMNMAEKRCALVIGNSNYLHENLLRAPISDAAKVADVLSGIGFKVYLLMDAQKSEMEQMIKKFSRESYSCDIALFYYEGHGLQIDGNMYLLPIESLVESPADRWNCVLGPYVVQLLDETLAKSKLIFIDACRSEGNYQMGNNTPYSMEAPADGVVMFSTQSGKYAYDGLNIPSTYFASAFVDKIKTPNVNVTEILSDIVVDVSKKTKEYLQQQIPTYSSSLTHKVILVKDTTPQQPIELTEEKIYPSKTEWNSPTNMIVQQENHRDIVIETNKEATYTMDKEVVRNVESAVFPLEMGKHILSVEASGCEPIHRTLMVTDRSQRKYAFTLQPTVPSFQFVMLDYQHMFKHGTSLLGFRYGQVRKIGWYVAADVSILGDHYGSNYKAGDLNNGQSIDGVVPFYDGRVSRNAVSAKGGMLVHLRCPLYFYFGGGVAYQSTTARMTNEQWVQLGAEWSTGTAFEYEVGLMANIKGFALRAGFGQYVGKGTKPVLGVGVGYMFDKK